MAKSKSQTRNASLKNYNRNPNGKGGFADHPELRNMTGQRNADAVKFARLERDLLLEYCHKSHQVTLPDGSTRKWKSRLECAMDSITRKMAAGEPWAVDWVDHKIGIGAEQLNKAIDKLPEEVVRIFVHNDNQSA